MSHTIQVTGINVAAASLTIVNYVAGGETVAPSEFGMPAIKGLVMGIVPPAQNSLGVPLFPILVSGKLQLFRFTSGVPVEIATTSALNAVVVGWLFN